MDRLLGIFLAIFGACFAIFSGRFTRGSVASSKEIFGITGGKPMKVFSRIMFILVGSIMAIAGLLMAVGVI
ncbi:hypothetical protein [Streptomyces candidus]|uniref:Uncharacterized protein n=1 Tax=Streptomyces candidus TaxID=67283 RepID=A0A7X0LSA1_9ACTN|nr:hypothetical protein [Streptomyces candidus]MBB6439035.1 hypothetical protein [Streptomyces candidus]GHH55404.1 hypothetical protein GCM10018773_59740 [Streptomyces candidus]